MKIRSDYVSNSSSSSFVIVGKTYDRSEIRKLIEDRGVQLFKMMKESKFSRYCNNYKDINDLIDGWGLREVFCAAGLWSEEEGECGDGDCILIGLDPSEMKDEQTLKEFKEVVVEKLKGIGLEAEVKDIGFVSGGTDSGGYTFIESCG